MWIYLGAVWLPVFQSILDAGDHGSVFYGKCGCNEREVRKRGKYASILDAGDHGSVLYRKCGCNEATLEGRGGRGGRERGKCARSAVCQVCIEINT